MVGSNPTTNSVAFYRLYLEPTLDPSPNAFTRPGKLVSELFFWPSQPTSTLYSVVLRLAGYSDGFSAPSCRLSSTYSNAGFREATLPHYFGTHTPDSYQCSSTRGSLRRSSIVSPSSRKNTYFPPLTTPHLQQYRHHTSFNACDYIPHPIQGTLAVNVS